MLLRITYANNSLDLSSPNIIDKHIVITISGLKNITKEKIMCMGNHVYIKQAATYFEQLKSRNISSARNKFIIIFSLFGLCASSVFADNYQFQVDGTYDRMQYHDDESKHYKMATTYYLSGVDDSVGPLAKADFLNKSSSITAHYSKGEYRYYPSSSTGGVKGRLVTDNDLIFEASYSKESFANANYLYKSYLLGSGLYINDSAAMKLTYQFNSASGISDDIYQLEYEQIISFNDNYVGVNGTIGHINPSYGDDLTYVGGTVDYYFNRQFSLGGTLAYILNQERDYGINTQYFLNNHVGLMGAYQIIDRYDGRNIKIMTLNLIGRF